MSLKHFTRETFEKELNGGALMLWISGRSGAAPAVCWAQ